MRKKNKMEKSVILLKKMKFNEKKIMYFLYRCGFM